MKSSWVKILISSFLTFILLLPYGGSLLHLFEDHEHKTCDISIVHIHEIDFDCDIFNYYFTPKIEVSNSIFNNDLIVYDKSNICLRPQLYFDPLNNPYFLRGPPFHNFS